MSDDNSDAIDAASRLAFDDVERALLSSTTEPEGDWKPGDPAIVKREPSAGSFETLMGAMGSKR